MRTVASEGVVYIDHHAIACFKIIARVADQCGAIALIEGDPSFSTPFRTLHAYSSKRIQHEFQTCIGDTWHKSKRTPPTARKNEGFTSHNQMSYRTLTHMNKHGPDVCFTDTVRTKIFRSICSCHLIWTADGSRPSVVAHISCAGMIPWKRKWKTGKRPWSHWPLSPQWHFAPQVSS